MSRDSRFGESQRQLGAPCAIDAKSAVHLLVIVQAYIHRHIALANSENKTRYFIIMNPIHLSQFICCLHADRTTKLCNSYNKTKS